MRLEHSHRRWISPVTPFVHQGVDGPVWSATRFNPPMPPLIPGKGYPRWVLEHRGRELVFASPQEIAHVADVLSQRVLPQSRALGQPLKAVNSHWLSRLHASFKSWRVREQVVKRLRETLAELGVSGTPPPAAASPARSPD